MYFFSVKLFVVMDVVVKGGRVKGGGGGPKDSGGKSLRKPLKSDELWARCGKSKRLIVQDAERQHRRYLGDVCDR